MSAYERQIDSLRGGVDRDDVNILQRLIELQPVAILSYAKAGRSQDSVQRGRTRLLVTRGVAVLAVHHPPDDPSLEAFATRIEALGAGPADHPVRKGESGSWSRNGGHAAVMTGFKSTANPPRARTSSSGSGYATPSDCRTSTCKLLTRP